jgi:2,3-bisphosphoglycerate-independent phosphoglycerate mutase
MKHIIILGDGMSDYPVERLDNRTPLEVASKPNIDYIANYGRCGMFRTLEDDLATGSAVANLSVLGYNPRECFQGRGVLEAASIGVDIGGGDMAMRCNLICIMDGKIKNHSAGHISTEEADEIIRSLQAELGSDIINFHTGVSYRHLFVGHGLDSALECFPPHDHPGEVAEDLMIQAQGTQAQDTANLLNDLTRRSWDILKDHPVNQKRREEGKDEASSVWFWSPGYRPTMWTFKEQFGVRGAVISAVDLIRGIGVYAGLEVIKVEGATGLFDTNYEGKADACLEALERVDFVYVHVEAPDEAGHEGDLDLKIKTIEDLDKRLVSRVLSGLEERKIEAVIGVLPDHATPVDLKIHVRDPVPFAILDPRKEPDDVKRYDEVSCAEGSMGMIAGDSFIRAIFGK